MNLKQQTAARALKYVESGMRLGLGTGSTTAYFVDMLGKKLQTGELKNIVGVPTSEKTAKHARSLGIPLTTLTDNPRLDLAVDGADEVDSDLNLIKGLGRALLREKIVEMHTDQLVIIVDESKIAPRLGTNVPLPVEIVIFEAEVQMRWLSTLGCCVEPYLEDDGSRIITDNGNYLALCQFDKGITDPYALARALVQRPGIVEHGLFLDMASIVIVAGAEGVRVMK